MPEPTKENEDFKKDFGEFISYWDGESKEIKQRELTEEDSRIIILNFELAKAKINLFRKVTGFSSSDYRKIDLIDNKLKTSIAIAKSNFRSKHITWWERLIDNIGGFLHIFKGT
jgi:hypothetical protein